MLLSNLLLGIEHTLLCGDLNKEIKGLAYDSRRVGSGDIFVCITGFAVDGHTFATSTVDKGAGAILCEKMPEGISRDSGITIVQVKNTREVLALLAAAFYQEPSKDMAVIGVTGTNGKTTITYLVKSILDGIGKKVGVIGTIENRIGERVIPTERTTPESLELQKLFLEMKEEEVSHVVMEVSSHSLDLHRVDAIDFDIGIFTNLTQDHLDYHQSMENYKIAKSLLFQRARHSVINIDDPTGAFMKACATGDVLTFGIDKQGDLMARKIVIEAEGVTFTLVYQEKEYPVRLHTPGRFSIYNALGAIGACLFLGVSMDDIIKGLDAISGVSGRFQTIRSKSGIHAVVDYAHTPDGLENILQTAKEFAKGKIITIFGCGGDRDRTKRPLMGKIAGELSDYCVITSDNPRTEEPLQILSDVEVGVVPTGCEYIKLVDRREAIRHAISMAQSGDLIMIAGKGHETYQIFPDKTIHFDDAEEVRLAFGEDLV